jgi:hypothetical protein
MSEFNFSDIPDGKQPMTHEAQRKFYESIPPEKTDPVLTLLRKQITPQDQDLIRNRILEDPEDWYVKSHFFFGMAIRNLLREHGYGEDYWPIWNLDDIYVHLLEESVKR